MGSPPGHWIRVLKERFPLFEKRLKSRGENTYETYVKTMDLFCRFLEDRQMDPLQLLRLRVNEEGEEVVADKRAFRLYAQEWLNGLKEAGVKPKGLNLKLTALRFFAKTYKVDLGIDSFKVPKVTMRDFIRKEELDRVFSFLKKNGRVIELAAFGLMATSGIRESTLVTLTRANFDETYRRKGLVLMSIGPEQNKGGNEYTTFTTMPVFQCVNNVIAFYDDYFHKTYDEKMPIFPLSTDNVSLRWRRIIERVGPREKLPDGRYRAHLHTLRKYFRTALDTAGVPEYHRNMLMGHFTSLDIAYSRLSFVEIGLDSLAENYLKALKFFDFPAIGRLIQEDVSE